MWRQRSLSLAGLVVAGIMAAATSKVFEMHSHVEINNTSVVVTNRDAFEWDWVQFRATDPCTWPLVRKHLKPGEAWTIEASELKTVDMGPFYPGSAPLRAYEVVAHANSGTGHLDWPERPRGVASASATPRPSPSPDRRCHSR